MEGRVRVEGLADLKRALKQIDADLPKEMRLEFKKVAETVVDRAKGKVPSGPTGRAKASVKPRASQTYAGIAAAGPKVPYFRWLDFGGTRARDDGSHASTRPFIKSGRYIFPTIADMGPDILDAAEEAVDNVLRKV